MTFVPCSPKHKSCSKFHAAMVRAYVEERERQESAFDEQTGAYQADKQHAKDKGAQLITFNHWLRASKTHDA